MVAKLIAWGEDRDTARGRAVTALRALRVEGIRTNRDFLIACVEDERSEEHTSELQSLMRTSYAVFCLKVKQIYRKYAAEINTNHERNDYYYNAKKVYTIDSHILLNIDIVKSRIR